MMCSSNNQQTVVCKVRAQVMSRDEYTGGWLPLPIRGGALCSVMLCKSTSNYNPSNGSTLPTNTNSTTNTSTSSSSSSTTTTSAHTFSQNYTNTATSTLATSMNSSCIINGLSSTTSNNINNGSESMITPHTEYFIIGKRIEDDKNVLNCCIKRDFIYNKVMPTFHHWKTNNCKFGLTFVTATEARLFDKAIKEAFNNMFNNEREKYTEDEDIFMSLDLPAATTASSSIVKSTSQTMASYLFSNSSSQRNEESSYVHLTPNVIPPPPPPSSTVPPPSTGTIKPSGHQIHPSSKNRAENSYQNVNLDDFSKNSPKLIQKPTSLLLGPNNNNISNNNNNINNNNTRKIVIEKPPFLPPTVNQSAMPLATAPSKKKQTWRKTISANGDTIAPASNNSPAKNPIHQPVKIQNGEKLQCKHCLQYYLPQSSPFSTLPGSRCRFNSYRDQQQLQCNNKSTLTKTKTNVLPSTPTSPSNTVSSSKTTDSDKSKGNFLFSCISAYRWFSFDRRNGHKSKVIKDDPVVNGHSKGEKTSKTVKNLCCSLASPSSSTCSYSSCPPTPPTSSNTLSSPASPNYRSNKSNNNNDHLHNREHQLQQNSFKSRRRKKERKKVEDDTRGICEGCDKALKEGKIKQPKCSTRRCLLSFLLPCLLCVRPLKACRHKMKLNQTKFCFCCRSDSSQP
ncbi:uncharacterized protein LOC141850488 isoform X2 [Brevipalpus obovatus]|uniref:uncharacterized protein LOC141850488 isoform X2 n=1 Tax=Brevipalpus obovatus TaxID=246614 RepID=UPI003D9F93A9